MGLNRRLNILLLALGILACPMLNSCFTGVESTPKIGANDLKKQNVTVTPEQRLLSDIGPEKFSDWKPGKEFLVTDTKIGIIFQPGTTTPNFSTGDILEFVEGNEVVSPVGKSVDIVLKKQNLPERYTYRINASINELNEREEVEIPFTVELGIADSIRERILNLDVYILTPRWYDSNDQLITRLKFIPIKIVNVEPGNFDFPVKVTFKPELDPDSKFAILNNGLYSVYMSVGNTPRSTRNFDTLFSLKDPRQRYSGMTDEVWQAIVENRLIQGMTRDEARLSIGSPKDVDRGHDYSSVYERWSYDGGIYLIFRDGILESYRR